MGKRIVSARQVGSSAAIAATPSMGIPRAPRAIERVLEEAGSLIVFPRSVAHPKKNKRHVESVGTTTRAERVASTAAEETLAGCIQRFTAIVSSEPWLAERKRLGTVIGKLHREWQDKRKRSPLGIGMDRDLFLMSIVESIAECLNKSPTHPFLKSFLELYGALGVVESVDLDRRATHTECGEWWARHAKQLKDDPNCLLPVLWVMVYLKFAGEVGGIQFEAAERRFARVHVFQVMERYPRGIHYSFLNYLGKDLFAGDGAGPFRNIYWHTVEIRPGDTLTKLIDARWSRVSEKRSYDDIVAGLMSHETNSRLRDVDRDDDLHSRGIRELFWVPPLEQHSKYMAQIAAMPETNEPGIIETLDRTPRESGPPVWTETRSLLSGDLLSIQLAWPREKVEDPLVGEPIEELDRFAAQLEQDLSPKRAELSNLLARLSGQPFSHISEQREFARKLNAILSRLDGWFSPDHRKLYRLKVSRSSGKLGVFHFQSGDRKILTADVLPGCKEVPPQFAVGVVRSA